MKHKYRLSDFTIFKFIELTNFEDRNITTSIWNLSDVSPYVIQRMEGMLNKQINECEREYGTYILEKFRSVTLLIIFNKDEKYIEIAVLSDVEDFDCFRECEMIYPTDEEYPIFKETFLKAFNNCVSERMKEIEKLMA